MTHRSTGAVTWSERRQSAECAKETCRHGKDLCSWPSGVCQHLRDVLIAHEARKAKT